MIDFENVSKTYSNGTNALHNVNIHIDKGEFVFIVGPSGAGKSTFLKLIMREETATSGEITINGNKLSTLRKRDVPYLRRHMGVVFQDFRLIDKMNVFDNVAFAMRAVGEKSSTVKKRVPYVLELVGLKDKMKDKPSELSGGEQQRVSLARALVNNPEIIIADEPTGNIDPELSYEILELLTRINSMGTTVLVVTHEHELVREFNQRVIAIDKGEVISDSACGEAPLQTGFHEQPEASADYAPPVAVPPVETVPVEPVPVETVSDETVPAEAAAAPAAPAPAAAEPEDTPAVPADEAPAAEDAPEMVDAVTVTYDGARFAIDPNIPVDEEESENPDNAVIIPE